MDFIKKQTVSSWISAGALILAFVSIIVFAVNSSVGYFKNQGVGAVIALGILAIVALIALILIAQFEIDGIVGKLVSIVSDILKIIVPIFLMLCMLYFLADRMEGLAYIFGSNEEILTTIQTPENLSSAYTAISGFILFGVASLTAIVGAFFSFKRKNIA